MFVSKSSIYLFAKDCPLSISFLSDASAERFRLYDEEFLAAGFAVQNDEQELIATAKFYAKELESLFAIDLPELRPSEN